MASPTYYVYIAKCADGSYYTGYTLNIELREREHNGLGKVGAKYTRSRRPVVIVYSEKFQTKSEALMREIEIKKMSRKKKLDLVHQNSSI